jgi:hypothetical protein
VALALAIILYFVHKKAKNDINAFVSTHITSSLLSEVFEVEEYNYLGHISKEMISGAGLVGSRNQCSGNDYMRGRYRGHGIVFSDILLEEAYQRIDSEGEKQEETKTIFNGPWMILDHDQKLPSSLRLRERPKVKTNKKALKEGEVETEDAQFNAQFQILTADRQMASLILTPKLMSFLISAHDDVQGDIFIRFARDIVYIAINNGKITLRLLLKSKKTSRH